MEAPALLRLDKPNAARQSEILGRSMSPAGRMADAIRALTIDATEQSNAGCPALPAALPMGMADVATALWTRFHKFDAADPRWPDRDRFVLSAGDGSMLLYALIHLTGHGGMSIDDIRNFRGLHSPAAGHPEYGGHPAIETTAGPSGQGLATAVGMALAERNMAARFGKSLVDHRTWVIASDDDLMGGISHEAAALAGTLGLSKLVVLYHDNRASVDGEAALAGPDDVLKRFSAYGWAAKQVDGHDPAQIGAALSFAVRSKKPTLIACRTAPDLGAATRAATDLAAGSPPGREPAAGAKQLPGWHEQPFVTPADVAERWHAAGSRGAAARRSWLKRLARHNQRAEFDRVMVGRLPDNWHEAVAEMKQDSAEPRPTPGGGAASQRCLEVLVTAMPELIGGSTGQTDADLTLARGMAPIAVANYGGRHIRYGMRGHGMAAAANGMALHGGIIPCVGTSVVFSDSLRPALRMSAIMHQRVVYVLTQACSGLDDGGATHQPVEHLASLRAMPNLHVHRPADSMEIAECWELALRRSDGPSVLVLSRRTLPRLRTDASENRCARGGYVLAEAEAARRATIIASGSEVPIAMAARDKLAADNVAVAVVSLPCWEQFALQDRAYRAQVLGDAPRVGVEAAGAFGWQQWLGPDGTFIGLAGFAASAGHPDSAVTADAVCAAVTRRLG